MSDFNDNDKLTIVEKRDLILQTGIQAIPHVGGSLATVVFGAKLERRLKRIERFLNEAALGMEGYKDSFASINEHDNEALAAILEELFEKVEREHVEGKIEYLKAYFRNTLIHPISKQNYDTRRFFLDALGSITILECEILGMLYKEGRAKGVWNIKIGEIDKSEIVGAVGRLKNYGFLDSFQAPGSPNIRDEYELVNVSDFGKRFYEFCLNT